MLEGPADSFKTSTMSTISSFMCLAALPGQIMEIHKHCDLTVANYTSNDPRGGTFGKSDGQFTEREWFDRSGTSREGPDHRLVTRYGAEPAFQGGSQPHTLRIPSILIAPMCPGVLSILMQGHPLNLQYHPTYSIRSWPYHHPPTMSV